MALVSVMSNINLCRICEFIVDDGAGKFNRKARTLIKNKNMIIYPVAWECFNVRKNFEVHLPRRNLIPLPAALLDFDQLYFITSIFYLSYSINVLIYSIHPPFIMVAHETLLNLPALPVVCLTKLFYALIHCIGSQKVEYLTHKTGGSGGSIYAGLDPRGLMCKISAKVVAKRKLNERQRNFLVYRASSS